MKVELLLEPTLEFGEDFISDDPKLGLSVGGFFSTSNKTHRSEVNYGVIGTQRHIEDTLHFISQFENYIEASREEFDVKAQPDTHIVDGEVVDDSEETEGEEPDALLTLFDFTGDGGDSYEEGEESREEIRNKRLNPDFIGFNKNSRLKCEFQNDEANNIAIKESKFAEILANKEYGKIEKSGLIADLFIDAYQKVLKAISKPNVCFIVVPKEVFKKCSSIAMGPGMFFNFRRYLKARLISLPNSIPVQIILEETLSGEKKSLQDLSMQAWNFCVANYYKNNCAPWTLSLKDKNTCFIGISFHKVFTEGGGKMRSSIAQAFNYEGKGIIFVGKEFKWDYDETHTKAPHLTYEYAKALMMDVINQYKEYNTVLPNRVVIHKTTDYWDSSTHAEYAEAEGLRDGIQEVLGTEITIDLVSIKSSEFKLLRKQGNYPVIRGTLLTLDKVTGVLYTTGYIPIYETYPGVHIPRPLEITIYDGDTTLKKVSQEILSLTKLNFNNCNYYDSLPITLRFAQKVGEIIQYMDENGIPPNKYYFYM